MPQIAGFRPTLQSGINRCSSSLSVAVRRDRMHELAFISRGFGPCSPTQASPSGAIVPPAGKPVMLAVALMKVAVVGSEGVASSSAGDLEEACEPSLDNAAASIVFPTEIVRLKHDVR